MGQIGVKVWINHGVNEELVTRSGS
jgi:ribosomal protein S3